MPEWFSVVILGIIEGITEFLPVSSTGHLLIAEKWLPHQSDLFNVVVQCGAVCAVLLVFARRVQDLVINWNTPENRDYLAKLLVAFLITAAGGLALKKLNFKLPEELAPVAWATLIGGVVLLAIEYAVRGKAGAARVTWLVAIAMGLAQLIAAVYPGASRSGTTIMIALALGVARPTATEFSFLLGIPTLLSAGGLKLVSAVKDPEQSVPWLMLALGTISAAVTAFLVVKWLLRYVQAHNFIPFAWYRIALGLVLLLLAAKSAA